MVPGAMINAHRLKTGPAQGPSQSQERQPSSAGDAERRGNFRFIYSKFPFRYRTQGTTHANTNLIKHTHTHTPQQLMFDFVVLYTITVQG